MRGLWEWGRRNDQAVEAGFWACQSVPAFYLGWVNSTAYVSGLSIYALIKGCVAAHHAKRSRKE